MQVKWFLCTDSEKGKHNQPFRDEAEQVRVQGKPFQRQGDIFLHKCLTGLKQGRNHVACGLWNARHFILALLCILFSCRMTFIERFSSQWTVYFVSSGWICTLGFAFYNSLWFHLFPFIHSSTARTQQLCSISICAVYAGLIQCLHAGF